MTHNSSESCFEGPIAALGGGGIGQIWGTTDEEEAIATIRAAADVGINFFDVAPLYGAAEDVVGKTFAGKYPTGSKVSTKCMVGNKPATDIGDLLSTSLDDSCNKLQRDFIDIFFLHGYIIDDGWRSGPRADMLDLIAMPWTLYYETIVPELEKLVESGRIGQWGITSGPYKSTKRALEADCRPAAIQAVTNALNAAGNMNITGEPEDPGAIVPLAQQNRVGVMGVRALGAGALTASLDRPVPKESFEAIDFASAAPFRRLAAKWGETPSILAYRYTLSMPGVDTVVLGVKNREELNEYLVAQRAPKLTPSEMKTIRNCFG